MWRRPIEHPPCLFALTRRREVDTRGDSDAKVLLPTAHERRRLALIGVERYRRPVERQPAASVGERVARSDGVAKEVPCGSEPRVEGAAHVRTGAGGGRPPPPPPLPPRPPPA